LQKKIGGIQKHLGEANDENVPHMPHRSHVERQRICCR
jgi:hypothetical protein